MTPSDLEVVMLNNLAEQARQRGDKEKAAALFHRALEIIAREAVDPGTEASVCTNFGLLLLSLGKTGEAVKCQRRALELDLRRGAPDQDLGYSHHNLGVALSESGSPEDGLQHLIKARDLRRAINDYQELVLTLEQLGEISLKLDRIDEAKAYAEEGLALSAVLGRNPVLRGVLGVLATVAQRRRDFELAVQLQVEILRLLEQLRRRYSDLDRLDLFDSRYNKRYLTAIELFLEAGRFREALAVIDRTRLRSACDLLEGVREFGSPIEADALFLPELREDELILVEWIYPKFDWSFPISTRHHDFKATKVVTSDRPGPPVQLDIGTEWRTHFETTLRQTQRVIDAYEKELSNVSRVVFVPHGVQWQTPFGALTHPSSRNRLQDTHEVLVAPSLRYCAITDSKERIASKRRVVIGDPTGDLGGARLEAQTVARILGVEPLIGRNATREVVLSALGGAEIDVLHYAGHGVYTETGLSALVLADGPLTAEDVRKCGFKANIVNLASCWGGMTTFSVWNELHGFVRALLSTGTENVVCSVYPLGDAVAPVFSRAFYDAHAAKARHPCSSFRIALKAIPSNADPFSWGGLYITGRR